jgi:putative copper resistance protein D
LVLALFVGAGGRAGRAANAIAMPSGAVALGSLAWTGHGAMDSGAIGIVHLTADIVHLLAAGAWVGALASLLWLLITTSDAVSYRTLAGFASTGSAIVAFVFISGFINSWLLVGPQNLLPLGTSPYGRLLLVKLALFAAMLSLAAINRFRLTPALGTAVTQAGVDAAMRRLRLSLTLEALAAFAILALVAWLGTLEPPASMM